LSSEARPNRSGVCLFVYGTLRRGYRNRYARLLAERSDFLGPARVQGRLYQLHSYPGLRLHHGAPWIAGELFRLRDARPLLSVLDRYEGSEYRRVRTVAAMRSRRVRCWVYELTAVPEPPASPGPPTSPR
jgi:gamma-glutamylcyclotransferase (GGCT)/AIG2-like uncharacterized protein YtfP